MKICDSCNFENPDGEDNCSACNSPLNETPNQAETSDKPHTDVDETAEAIDRDPAKKLCGHCVGQVIDMRYIITGTPCCDPCGKFCKGEDAGDDSPVIIRQIPESICDNEKALTQLNAAFEKLATLKNDKIITPLDAQLENPFKYFVLADNSGSTLTENLTDTPLDVENALEIFKHTAEALDYLHFHNLIHGDITPDNIIISGKNVMLANPCISELIKEPEKFSSEAISPTRRDDIYSLAKCFYFAVSGEYPESEFSPLGVLGESQNAALEKALSDEPLARQASAKDLMRQLGISSSELNWITLRVCGLSTFAHKGGKILLPPNNSIKCDENAEITIKADCDDNYHFTGWSGSAVDADKVADVRETETTLLADDDYTLIANFAIDTHQIETSASKGGTVTKPASGESIEHGKEILIHACPDKYYHFAEWSGKAVDDGKIGNPKDRITTVTVDEDISMKADFAKNCYSLSIVPSNGGRASKSEPQPAHEYGSVIIVTAEADENYRFVKWTGSAVDAGMVENAGSERTAVTIEGEYSIAPVFELKKHQLNLSATEGGFVVKPDGESMTFEHGSTVEIKACPDRNYHFVRWTGDGAEDAAASETKVKLNSNMSLTAEFAVDSFPITVSSADGGKALIIDADQNEFEYGTKLNIAAENYSNYHFVEWTGTAVVAGMVEDTKSPDTVLTVKGPYTLQAVFAINWHELKLLSCNGGSIIIPSQDSQKYAYGSWVNIKALADKHHHFVKWTGSAADENKIKNIESDGSSISIDDDMTLSAVFAIDKHTARLTAATGGSAQVSSEENEFDHGSQIEITAIPDENYHFVKWAGLAADSGLIADTNAETTALTVKCDTYAEAVFALDKRKLTITSVSGGSVVSPGQGEFYFDHGEEVKVEARAEQDHHFERWQGTAAETGTDNYDKDQNPEPASAGIIITMDQDKTLHADFDENLVTITSLTASHKTEMQALESRFMKKLYILAAITLLLMIIGLVNKGKIAKFEDSLSNTFDNAVKHAENSRYSEALVLAKAIQEISPELAKDKNIEELTAEWKEKQSAQSNFNKLELTRNAFQKSQSKLQTALYNEASRAYSEKNYELAIALYEVILQFDPANESLKQKLADTKKLAEKSKKAVE